MSEGCTTPESDFSMAYFKAGAIVWVRRKNGSWWPGRVMDLNEVSSSSFYKSRLNGKLVQLLGRDNGTVDWYNVKSKRIKAFRCSEFIDCIKRVESSRSSLSTKSQKYAHRTDAILHALELENKEPSKKRKLIDYKAETHQNESVCKSKRSRCVYLPVGSRKCLERTSSHTQPSQAFPRPRGVGRHSYQSSSSENIYALTPRETHSSNNYNWDGERDETVKQLSDCHSRHPSSRNYKKHDEFFSLTTEDRTAVDVVALERNMQLKLKYLNKRSRDVPDGQRYITSMNGIHDKSDTSTAYVALEHHTKPEFYSKSLKRLRDDVYFPSSYAFQDGSSAFPGRETRSSSSREMLIDVNLIVQANTKGEHVPLISLASKLNGKAIIGHPVEVEALKDGSMGILLPMSNDVGNQVFHGIATSLLQPVPKTARTPVSYLPTPSPSSQPVPITTRTITVTYPPTPSFFPIPKDVKTVKVHIKQSHGRLGTRKNSSCSKEQLLKPLKKRILSSQKVREPTNLGDFELVGWSRLKDHQTKSQENLSAPVTCVPVKLIMSKLLTAMGQQPADICA